MIRHKRRRRLMLLIDFLRDYAARRVISDRCLSNYRKHLADLARFLNRQDSLTTRDLDQQSVDRWLASKIADGRSPYYVHAIRASILAVWNDAHRCGLAGNPPNARRVQRPDLIIRCWSPADVDALIQSARQLPGIFERVAIPRGPYIASAIAATWYAGIRRGDLHRIRWDQITADGSFAIVQSKTGRRHVARIPRRILNEIGQFSRPPGPIWPRPGSDELIRRQFQKLVATVRAELPEMIDGRWRDIRRSAENSAERLYPGRGHLLAGHERRTFERYYRQTEDFPSVAPADLELDAEK